jgi:uncharacterized membrane protein YadS
MIALVLAIIIANIPPVKEFLAIPSGGRIKWTDGLGFIDKMILRATVMLLGFSLQFSTLRQNPMSLVVSILVISLVQPMVFWVAQLTGRCFKLSPEARDMLSAGTMICGASAITAFQAVLLNASKEVIIRPTRDAESVSLEEQKKKQEAKIVKYTGLCTSAVFVYSLVALVCFPFIGRGVGFSNQTSGLWAGLAVNDLSSAIAVGSEFGPDGTSFATLSKTIRILTLAPHLLWMGFRAAKREHLLLQDESFIDAEGGSRPKVPFLQTLWANFPLFMVGFAFFFGLRATLDTALQHNHSALAMVKDVDMVFKLISKGMMNSVTAAIGLRLEIKKLMKAWRYVAVEGIAWLTVASLSFGLLLLWTKLLQNSITKLAIIVGVILVLVLVGGILYYLGRRSARDEIRLLQGDNVSLSWFR